MNKKMIVITAAVAALALGSVSVYASEQVAKSSAISKEAAFNFAYVDAGITADEATQTEAGFERENGKYVYEIEFTAGNTEYDYTIDASNGKILEKEVNEIPGAAGKATQKTSIESEMGTLNSALKEQVEDLAAQVRTDQQQEDAYITVEEAKTAALSKAGLSANEVSFSKAKFEKDGSVAKYEIEFYTADNKEYDVDIDAMTGAVLDYEVEQNGRTITEEQDDYYDDIDDTYDDDDYDDRDDAYDDDYDDDDVYDDDYDDDDDSDDDDDYDDDDRDDEDD